jgi:hypothetical protein
MWIVRQSVKGERPAVIVSEALVEKRMQRTRIEGREIAEKDLYRLNNGGVVGQGSIERREEKFIPPRIVGSGMGPSLDMKRTDKKEKAEGGDGDDGEADPDPGWPNMTRLRLRGGPKGHRPGGGPAKDLCGRPCNQDRTRITRPGSRGQDHQGSAAEEKERRSGKERRMPEKFEVDILQKRRRRKRWKVLESSENKDDSAEVNKFNIHKEAPSEAKRKRRVGAAEISDVFRCLHCQRLGARSWGLRDWLCEVATYQTRQGAAI